MSLQDEIPQQSAQIKTDSYPMSIEELLNLYRDEELARITHLDQVAAASTAGSYTARNCGRRSSQRLAM